MRSRATLGASPSILQSAWAIGLDFFHYFMRNDTSWEPAELAHADLKLADGING